ncbi:response regulator, partial [Escherichia coli]|nr:response regulator [Escherichia coli]
MNTLVKQLREHVITNPSFSTDEQKTILVVDDDPNIRQLLRQQLEVEGYVIKEARNGLEALTLVKQTALDLI